MTLRMAVAGDPPAWDEGPAPVPGLAWDGTVDTVTQALAALAEGRVGVARIPGGSLPDPLPEGLAVGAVLERREPRDVVATRAGAGTALDHLTRGTRVGLLGPRRTILLGLHRPDLMPVALGDPGAAGAALADGRLDALVVANRHARHPALAGTDLEALDVQAWTPSMGQGVDVLVVRTDESDIRPGRWDHPATRQALAAERAVARGLGGGSRPELGVLAVPYGRWLRLWASVADSGERRLVRVELSGGQDHPEQLGRAVARALLDRGAGSLLR